MGYIFWQCQWQENEGKDPRSSSVNYVFSTVYLSAWEED